MMRSKGSNGVLEDCHWNYKYVYSNMFLTPQIYILELILVLNIQINEFIFLIHIMKSYHFLRFV